MNERERLIELMLKCDKALDVLACYNERPRKITSASVLSDFLMANGVTVQELALPEEDYYVLRNPDTGMYFRGKGVNGWGKHFNQATIYRVKGTAERSIREVAWNGAKAQLVRIKIVEMPQPPKEKE